MALVNQETSSLLCCPHCRCNLVIQEDNDQYSCAEHGNFEATNGLLSFTNHDHFDDHWKDNYYESIPEKKLHVASNFLEPILTEKAGDNPTYLDAGCGDGVHIQVLNNAQADQPANKIAIDISTSALHSAKKRDSKDWQFIHGDVGMLPFKGNAFDTVFSFGVLAYTPNPRQSFAELVRVTKPGGKIGIWIYPKSGGLGGVLFGIVRGICKITGSFGTNLIANMIVPVLGLLPTQSRLSLVNASWKQCKEIVLVNIAPEQLFFPTSEEIVQWFEEEKLEILVNEESNPITIWGKK